MLDCRTGIIEPEQTDSALTLNIFALARLKEIFSVKGRDMFLHHHSRLTDIRFSAAGNSADEGDQVLGV